MNLRKRVRNVACDGCGRLLCESEWMEDSFEGWDALLQSAEWERIGRRCYCPRCYEIGEDDAPRPVPKAE